MDIALNTARLFVVAHLYVADDRVFVFSFMPKSCHIRNGQRLAVRHFVYPVGFEGWTFNRDLPFFNSGLLGSLETGKEIGFALLLDMSLKACVPGQDIRRYTAMEDLIFTHQERLVKDMVRAFTSKDDVPLESDSAFRRAFLDAWTPWATIEEITRSCIYRLD